MKVVSSYGVEIKKQNIPIRHTLYIYRQAVGYLIRVYEESWEELSRIVNLQKRFNAAEHLVHSTKKNRARYDFDQKFPKMPSYLRRSAIQHALGSVSSYETRLELWKQKKLDGKPKLVYENHAMPVFYRDVMYKEAEDQTDRAFLKLYDGHDWKWFSVNLLHTDMEYLRENWSGVKASAPTLEKRHHKYFLRFSYTEEVSLSKKEVNEQIICSVDLGINTDAVCTIMRSDGTVLGRKFINFPSEKDQMYRVVGRIRRFQREHGSGQVQSRWNYARRLNMELSRKVASAITTYAQNNHVDVVMSDIEMPQINGLELARQVSKKGTKVVIISSHQNYEYFRSAIQLNVADFLLKPIKSADIIACFERIKQELDERNHIEPEQNKSYYEKILDEVKKYIEDNFQEASLEAVAIRVNLSASYLSRILKEKCDFGFAEYLVKIRMEKAAL